MIGRVQGLLGLARRAGKLKAGFTTCCESVLKGEARLVVVAEDAGVGVVREFTRLCNRQRVSLFRHGTRELLGRAIGKAPCSVLAVTDDEFAGAVERLLARRPE